MAQFRAIIRGNRNSVSRLGGKKSGITAQVNGWDLGIKIDGYIDTDGRDTFRIYKTGGSNDRQEEVLITTIKK